MSRPTAPASAADGDTVADPPDATGHRIEFALQRRPESMPGDRLADRVEVAQPVERRRECFAGPVLGLGQTFEARAADPALESVRRTSAAHSLQRRVRPGWPSAVRSSVTNVRSESADVTPPFAPHERAEPDAPVVVTGHPGLTAGAFPRRGRLERPRRVAGGTSASSANRPCRRRPRRSMSSRSSTRRGSEPLAEQRAGAPVPEDAGGVQMVLDQPGIRSLRRPEHPDPLERDTAAGGVEHGAHGVADLVVGVGRRDDRDLAARPTRAGSTLDPMSSERRIQQGGIVLRGGGHRCARRAPPRTRARGRRGRRGGARRREPR